MVDNQQTTNQQNPDAKALLQNNQQFLTEIGSIAKQMEQMENDQSLKQVVSQLNTVSQQVKFNEQSEQNLNAETAGKLAQNNQQFLAEMGQLAGQIQQKSTNQQVQQYANQISQFITQINNSGLA